MDNDNFSFLADAESSITGDKTEGLKAPATGNSQKIKTPQTNNIK